MRRLPSPHSIIATHDGGRTALIHSDSNSKIYFHLIMSSRKGGKLMALERVCLVLFGHHGSAIGAYERGQDELFA
jgi:hypothetical protein